MGLHWFKHRPKVRKKKRLRPRTAINIDDMQLIDNKVAKANPPVSGKNTPSDSDSKGGSEADGDANVSATASETAAAGDNNTSEDASDTQEILTASDTTGLNADPVIFAFNHLKRNPFERSPYVKLIEKIKKEEKKVAEETGKGKVTKQLQAVYSATIQTDNDLVAVIDSNLYRKGSKFKNAKISSITQELVYLNTPTTLYLIPKVGVKLNIASSGAYTFSDDFRK